MNHRPIRAGFKWRSEGDLRPAELDQLPAELDQLGLLPALLALFECYTKQTGVLVDFKHHGADGRFLPEVETTAYRIVQEALTNVARHAGVSEVTIRIRAKADLLLLQIEDRGRGFDPSEVPAACRDQLGSQGCESARSWLADFWRSIPVREPARWLRLNSHWMDRF